MGLETIALIALAASTAASVHGTLEQKKAVKQEAKVNARIERRNGVQQQLDLQHNQGVEKANQKEAVMDAAFQRQQIMKQAKRQRAASEAQLRRQGVSSGPSLDAVLKGQMLEEQDALNDAKMQQSRATTQSRGRGRTFNRDAFAVREISETNAQATLASGANRAKSLGISAVGQGLSGLSGMASTKQSFN